MTVTKEQYVDLCENYNKMLKLLDQSKSDPPNDPYASKYAAREILINMKSNLENLSRNYSIVASELLRVTGMLGTVYLYLGMISIDTEESSAGENYLHKCHDTIKQYFHTPQMIEVTLNMYNQFGILWSQKEPDKSKTYLEEAEKLYLEFKKSSRKPTLMSQFFCNTPQDRNDDMIDKNFEKIHTLTLYYLAQIYGALQDALKSSVYCHITLQRQLDSGEYDPIDWALNAATLSQFFMERNGFKQARHHLAASTYILNEYEKTLNAIVEHDDDFYAKMEIFKHRAADVARCWAKYGLLLLANSKERLLNHTDDIDKNCSLSSDLRMMNLDADANVTLEELQNLEFASLDLREYEGQITDKFILTIGDARPVFLNIQTWLQKAESYYTLDALASDHIEIIQDKSQMYLGLLFFEDNMENQAKLNKRRIDLLENIIKNISPQYYLQYCRQIWFELAQTYSDILNVKYDKLRESEKRPTPHMLSKINLLTERSIHNFTCFINSFKEVAKANCFSKIPTDFQKPFLQAYFHIAALNGRYITMDKKVQLINTENSYQAYKQVLDYCNSYKEAIELIPMEYSICKEMVDLLPVKIAKLTHELSLAE